LKQKIKSAGILVIASYGLSQSIRLGGNLIVARLLAPKMFGIMAIVHVLIYGIEMFSDLGLKTYIIRNKDYRNTQILNTVWSMQVVRGWLVSIFMLTCATSLYYWQQNTNNISELYTYPSLPIILAIIGISPLLRGYQTLAPAILSRELQRGKLELSELISQFAGVLTMVIWAWYFPSIWALVSANLVTLSVLLLLNYQLFEFRHSFSWDKVIVKKVFHFGKWIVLASMITFFSKQTDKIFFSVMITPTELGVYSIAFMIASFITLLIETLTIKLWLPVLSNVHNNSVNNNSLNKIFYKIRLRQDAAVGLGMVFIGFYAPLLIDIMYDARYSAAAWMIQIILISTLGLSISSINQALLTALGNTKVQMQVVFVRAISLTILLPTLYAEYKIQGAIYAVAFTSYVGIPVQYKAMHKFKIFNFIKEIRIVFIAIIAYSALVLFPHNFIENIYLLLDLFIDILHSLKKWNSY